MIEIFIDDNRVILSCFLYVLCIWPEMRSWPLTSEAFVHSRNVKQFVGGLISIP